MTSYVPKSSFALMATVYRKIFPAVNEELSHWQSRAEQIPDPELRTQALASIRTKRFHCLGGAVYSLLAGDNWRTALRFIVAYQTISDYLDNLCDRSTSMDPADFRLLHESMGDALSQNNCIKNYYQFRNEQRDGEYLADLVRTCQGVMRSFNGYEMIRGYLLRLGGLYGDLQVHKHVKVEERLPRLKEWYSEHNTENESLSWYEFAAAAGSTLGIFCLVSYALDNKMSCKLAESVMQGYFPYMQGLHILLDYYIDQLEDREEGDLNFCSYYDNREQMKKRLVYFIEQANWHTDHMPDSHFHKMVCRGLVGLYLGDPKVKSLDSGAEMTRKLLQVSGHKARFFNWNTRLYYRLFS
ncbi:tetraprenyl-beta-curcumene synthase family protein [Virgibacillus kekensis]|uniref:Tetraprenyl-beta-curcumene synthase family protein n=1 Tax=Virgibacillus kekensis TaxID=202261 RepID=A0ABV9DKA6_9BACI